MDVSNYYKMIGIVVGRYKKELRQDLFNDGVIITMNALKRWKEGSGNKKAYIYTTLLYQLRNSFKKYESVNNNIELSTDRYQYSSIDAEDYLNRFLKSIPDSHRIILEKHYLEGYTTDEIAKLYCNITGIKTRESVSRILKQYKK